MSDPVSPKDNPRVVVIQKLYSHQLNKESEITFSKHRYKKFIKDVVNGTIERKELFSITHIYSILFIFIKVMLIVFFSSNSISSLFWLTFGDNSGVIGDFSLKWLCDSQL